MSAKFCLLIALLHFDWGAVASAQAQEPSQAVALDRTGNAALWALDLPLEAPLSGRLGARLGMRLSHWLSSWGELRFAWTQKPSIVRLGASAWPIGKPLRGIFISLGPELRVAPEASVGFDAFVETGFRYGWEGVALTVGASWDLKRHQVVPALSVMLGCTFGGVS